MHYLPACTTFRFGSKKCPDSWNQYKTDHNILLQGPIKRLIYGNVIEKIYRKTIYYLNIFDCLFKDM